MIPYMPFNLHDFFLVGVWLIVVYGSLPIILAAGLWFGKKWSWWGALDLGAVVVTWIVVEMYLFYSFGFTIFYPLIGGIGVLTITVLCLQSSREYCKYWDGSDSSKNADSGPLPPVQNCSGANLGTWCESCCCAGNEPRYFSL
jgi:hypothetical protein